MLWLLVIIPALTGLYFWFIRRFNYWKNRGVTSVIPESILENFLIVRKKSVVEFMGDMHLKSPDERYIGLYTFGLPVLLLKDPDLIKKITIKEFDSFVDHRTFAPEDIDPLWGKNLFASTGDRWRKSRALISPVFTSNKMKSIFLLMDECARQFSNFFLEKEEDFIELELKQVFNRYANDVIATTAFGLRIDSLKYPNNEFFLTGKRVTDFGILNILRFFIHSICPSIARFFKIRIFPKSVLTYFKAIIEDTIKIRQEEKIIRPDLIHLLMETKKEVIATEVDSALGEDVPSSNTSSDLGKTKTPKTMNLELMDIVSHAFMFFFAGFEPTSVSMSFLAYELVVNPDIQDRLIEEVDQVFNKCGENVTYEALLGMKYLDMVVSEVLRKWPPTPIADRKCTRPFTIEPELPEENPLRLEVGDVCVMSIFGIHRDPKNYPDPEKFDPERFNDENKVNIRVSTYLPFGIGPRICIGNRYALLEIKVIYFYLLLNFTIVPTEKTQIPIILNKRRFNMEGEGGMYVGLKKRKAL